MPFTINAGVGASLQLLRREVLWVKDALATLAIFTSGQTFASKPMAVVFYKPTPNLIA